MAYFYPEMIEESDKEMFSKQRSTSKIVVFQRLQMLRLLKSLRAKTLVAAAPLVGATERSLQGGGNNITIKVLRACWK